MTAHFHIPTAQFVINCTLKYGSFHVNSTNFLELSSMTTSEFDEIFKT